MSEAEGSLVELTAFLCGSRLQPTSLSSLPSGSIVEGILVTQSAWCWSQ
jgi:hypothetical protein